MDVTVKKKKKCSCNARNIRASTVVGGITRLDGGRLGGEAIISMENRVAIKILLHGVGSIIDCGPSNADKRENNTQMTYVIGRPGAVHRYTPVKWENPIQRS